MQRTVRRAAGLVGGALAGTLVLLLLLAVARDLVAHGALRRATPAAGARVPAPGELRLEFTEAAELSTTAISLTDAAGRTVRLGPVAHAAAARDSQKIVVTSVAEALAPGRYTVSWQVTGKDGHPVRGRYAFEVIGPAAVGAPGVGDSGAGVAKAVDPEAGGPPRLQDTAGADPTRNPAPATATPDAHAHAAEMASPRAFDAESPVYVALRWLTYIALLAGIGAVLMARVAERAATVGARHAVGNRLAAIGLAAAWLGVALALARLLAQSWAIHGADRATSPMLLGPLVGNSAWGRAWSLQLLAALLAATGFTLALSDSRRRAGWRIAGVAAGLAVVGTAMAGHAAAAEGWRLPVLVTAGALHVLGAGIWIGGVMMLALAVLPRLEAPAAANLVRAFSPWGLIGAAMLALTGPVAALGQLSDPLAPWESRYGRILLLKIGLVLLVVLLGALNWRRRGPAAATVPGKAALRRAVAAEVLLAILVLGATAVLVAVSPLE